LPIGWCGALFSARREVRTARWGAQLVLSAHPAGWWLSPSMARRARFTAASSWKSAATFVLPRTRARRPPCLRRMRWAILRSTVGRVCV
jgi:hypothetical protein